MARGRGHAYLHAPPAPSSSSPISECELISKKFRLQRYTRLRVHRVSKNFIKIGTLNYAGKNCSFSSRVTPSSPSCFV